MGSTTNINVTIMPEKSLICQRLEGKHTALHIALDVVFCYTRVAKFHKYVKRYAYLPSAGKFKNFQA
jgi:hypothetical protein